MGVEIGLRLFLPDNLKLFLFYFKPIASICCPSNNIADECLE